MHRRYLTENERQMLISLMDRWLELPFEDRDRRVAIFVLELRRKIEGAGRRVAVEEGS